MNSSIRGLQPPRLRVSSEKMQPMHVETGLPVRSGRGSGFLVQLANGVRNQGPLWVMAGILTIVGLLVNLQGVTLQSSQEMLDSTVALRRPCVSSMGENPGKMKGLKLNTLSFLGVGDWGLDTQSRGEYGDQTAWDVDELKRLATTMGYQATRQHSNFVVNVGDSFYQYGVSDPSSSRWLTTFDRVFESDVLRNIYWYSVLGNHDWKANYWQSPDEDSSKLGALRGGAMGHLPVGHGAFSQIQHTFSGTNLFRRWCMPSLNFTVEFELDGVDDESIPFKVKLVAFDSQVLIKKDPDVDTGAYAVPGVPTENEMLSWLETEICAQRNEYDWLITVSHHFIASVGNYFLDPNFAVMQGRVLEVMKRCKVSLHLHGHDHITQVIRLPGNILQVGIGSAGKTNGNVLATPTRFQEAMGIDYTLEYADTKSAFADVQISRENISLNLLSSNSAVLYSTQVTRQGV